MLWVSLGDGPDHLHRQDLSFRLLSAFAVVCFRFRGRMFFFWMIFVTLMLPVEVRIAPDHRKVGRYLDAC